jgi:hypothetical protein
VESLRLRLEMFLQSKSYFLYVKVESNYGNILIVRLTAYAMNVHHSKILDDHTGYA